MIDSWGGITESSLISELYLVQPSSLSLLFFFFVLNEYWKKTSELGNERCKNINLGVSNQDKGNLL